MVDRLFRNILADMTGNTHRTEFCIDKMYAPESSTGRLGLVEYRALEMPPHPQMAAAQMLLMRSAIAAFWKTPYDRRLVRWGTGCTTSSCCRTTSPRISATCSGDGRSRLPAAEDWFAPHLEFRFPLVGEVTLRGARSNCAMRWSPGTCWARSRAAAARSRYVDSSTNGCRRR